MDSIAYSMMMSLEFWQPYYKILRSVGLVYLNLN